MTDFSATFDDWLRVALASPVSPDVEAFSFNLFELGTTQSAKFGVELIGAGEFNPTSSDWACAEVWEPMVRRLTIPLDYCSGSWEQCQVKIQLLVASLIGQDSHVASVLKSRKAVAVGFVDGDLHVVWQP